VFPEKKSFPRSSQAVKNLYQTPSILLHNLKTKIDGSKHYYIRRSRAVQMGTSRKHQRVS
jgi:hypothetical protein